MTRKIILTILGGLLVCFMYAVFVADKALCILSIRPRVGFRKWLHNPKVQILRQEGAIDHDLQSMSFIRVIGVLLIWWAYVLIW